MLDLIGYDIVRPRSQSHLRSGIAACSDDSHNLRYAPWFIETRRPPRKVLEKLVEHLGTERNDRLLVLELGEATSGAYLNLRTPSQRWLRQHGVSLGGSNASGILGIAYTLHGARSHDYTRLARSISRMFPDHHKPLHALWFVATRKSPRTVCDELAKELPSREEDELLVLEVPLGRIRQSVLPEADSTWFDEHRILVN